MGFSVFVKCSIGFRRHGSRLFNIAAFQVAIRSPLPCPRILTAQHMGDDEQRVVSGSPGGVGDGGTLVGWSIAGQVIDGPPIAAENSIISVPPRVNCAAASADLKQDSPNDYKGTRYQNELV